MHPCTNLNLLVIGQNVFTTARFNIYIDAMKKNLNRSTLELVTWRHLEDEPRFAPIKDFLILTLHTPRTSLDSPLISFFTSWPNHETCSSPSKKISNFLLFATKPRIAKILKRCLLVGKKVLYKSPNDIPFKLSTLRAVNARFVFPWITQTAIARTPDPEKNPPKKRHFSFHIVTHLCQFMAPKFRNLGGQKKSATFWHVKNCHFMAQQMANRSRIQKSVSR